jgi:hypothetical protein
MHHRRRLSIGIADSITSSCDVANAGDARTAQPAPQPWILVGRPFRITFRGDRRMQAGAERPNTTSVAVTDAYTVTASNRARGPGVAHGDSDRRTTRGSRALCRRRYRDPLGHTMCSTALISRMTFCAASASSLVAQGRRARRGRPPVSLCRSLPTVCSSNDASRLAGDRTARARRSSFAERFDVQAR